LCDIALAIQLAQRPRGAAPPAKLSPRVSPGTSSSGRMARVRSRTRICAAPGASGVHGSDSTTSSAFAPPISPNRPAPIGWLRNSLADRACGARASARRAGQVDRAHVRPSGESNAGALRGLTTSGSPQARSRPAAAARSETPSSRVAVQPARIETAARLRGGGGQGGAHRLGQEAAFGIGGEQGGALSEQPGGRVVGVRDGRRRAGLAQAASASRREGEKRMLWVSRFVL